MRGKMVRRLLVGLALVVLVAGGCGRGQTATAVRDDGSSAASQTIDNKGSDTLVNLALAWAESYMGAHPDMRISVTGGGTGTGIAAMLNGTVDIANASRAMKDEESTAAKANGIDAARACRGGRRNRRRRPSRKPGERLTLQQLSDIYTGKIQTGRRSEARTGRSSCSRVSPTPGRTCIFLENVVRLGEKSDLLFSPETLLMPSSEGISAEVRQNPNAIGYDGLGYVTPDQKVIAVAKDGNSPYVFPSENGEGWHLSDLARVIHVYSRGATRTGKAYLDWVRARGRVMVALGFVPLTK